MSVKRDDVNVVVMIDGKQAVNQLGELEMKSRDIKASLKDMKKGTDEYIQANKQLDKVTADVKQLRAELGLEGMTLQQLRNYQRDLNREYSNVTIGTQRHQELKTKLQEVNGVIAQQGKELKKVGDAAQQSGGFMSSFMGNFVAGLAQNALSSVISFGKESIKAFQESQQATAQLQASLKSTGGAAGITENEITSLSKELQKLTNIDDDVTNSAASLLLTFTEVKDKAFKQAIPLIQDMAVKMAGGSGGEIDLKSATIQVGKALNDPIKGVSALAKVGVSFTEVQKQQIAAMVEMGDTAGAQTIILKELDKEFGGSARAAAIAEGGMGKFKVAMGELSENVGEKLLPALDEISEAGLALAENLDPAFHALGSAVVPIQNLWQSVVKLITTFVPLGDKVSSASFLVKAWAFGLNMATAPVKILATAISALIDWWVVLINVGKQVLNFMGADFEADISGSWKKLTGNIISNSEAIIDSYKGVSDAAGKAADAIIKAQEAAAAKPKGGDGKKEKEKAEAEAEAERRRIFIRSATIDKLKTMEDDDAKEELARRNKISEALKKERELHEKEELDAAKNIQKLKLAVYEDDLRGKLLRLQAQAQQEKEALKGTDEQIAEQELLIDQKLMKDILKVRADAHKVQADADKRAADEQAAADRTLAQKAYNARLAINDLEIIRAQGNHSKLLELQLERLRIEEAHELENKELTASELEAIDEKYAAKAKALKLQNFQQTTQEIGQLAANAITQVQGFIDAISQKNISKEESQKSKRLATLDQELASKKISEKNYAKEKEQIAQEEDKKINDLKTKQAKADKAAAIAQAIIAGALSVVSNLKYGPAAAIVAGITAAISVAKIIATPIPKFAQGGFTSFAGGGHIGEAKLGLIGEAGPEYVISNPMLKNPKVANFVGMLENMRTARAFADGGFTTTELLNTNRIPLTPETNNLASAPNPGNQGRQQDDQSAQLLLTEIKGLRQDVKDMEGRLKVVYTDIEQVASDVNKVRVSSTI